MRFTEKAKQVIKKKCFSDKEKQLRVNYKDILGYV